MLPRGRRPYHLDASRQPYLNKLGYCHKRAPGLILSKIGQTPFKICTKVSPKVEAFKLGKFRGSIWMSLEETSGSEVFYLDRPSSRKSWHASWALLPLPILAPVLLQAHQPAAALPNFIHTILRGPSTFQMKPGFVGSESHGSHSRLQPC